MNLKHLGYGVPSWRTDSLRHLQPYNWLFGTCHIWSWNCLEETFQNGSTLDDDDLAGKLGKGCQQWKNFREETAASFGSMSSNQYWWIATQIVQWLHPSLRCQCNQPWLWSLSGTQDFGLKHLHVAKWVFANQRCIVQIVNLCWQPFSQTLLLKEPVVDPWLL